MEPALVLQAVSTFAIVGSVTFAGFQWRAARLSRRRESQVAVLRSFEAPPFVKAMRTILDLPDGLTAEETLTQLGPDGIDLAWYWLGVMESLGILVHDRFVTVHDVDQTYGGPVFQSFRKLRPLIEATRRRTGREAMHEWFQWLAELLERYERDEGRTPAHIRERDWLP